MTSWNFDEVPSQLGRTAIVTGANSGIGFAAARMLARKGASVVLACRDPQKGANALQGIRAENPIGAVTLEALDLADFDSVAAFAQHFAANHDRVDLLINNAGVMIPPLGRTRQDHELQFGTNHLGHFALTARLLPLLEATPAARIVVVSSSAQNIGRIDFDDLDWRQRPYRPWLAYGQSKLANMLFALELQRRLTASGSALKVTASHPGWTSTDLVRTAGFLSFLGPLLGMTPDEGALTTLRAATDPTAEGGSYWGPAGITGMSGPPDRAQACSAARDEAVAARLFDESERLTGVSFAFRGVTATPRAPPRACTDSARPPSRSAS